MKIICGLGNPGKQYEYTHHNMGFLALDEIAGRFGVSVKKLKFKSLLGETSLFGEKIVLVKPQTFMNNSGEAVREVMNFYKAGPEDLFIIYDDIDMERGRLRVRASGSSGSHNGMKSVIYQLRYDNFPRCRIGIGGSGNVPLISFVLSQISDEEAKVLMPAVSKAADAAIVWAQYGIKAAMDFANVSDETRKEKAEKKNSVIKTKNLIIRRMSERELEKYTAGLPEGGQKDTFEALLRACRVDTGEKTGMTPFVIRMKSGGKEAGAAYIGEDGNPVVYMSEEADPSLEEEAKAALLEKND